MMVQIVQDHHFAMGIIDQIRRKLINTERLRQNRRCSTDDIFKFIFLNENAWI